MRRYNPASNPGVIVPLNRSDTVNLRSVNILAVVEQTAFFAAYIMMGVYLVEVAGFDDVGAGWVAGAFGMALCLLPSMAGAVADRIGFRSSLVGAYVLQSAGFGILSIARSPWPAIAGLAIVAVGGATTRSILMGTVGRTEPSSRTRAYSVMMQAINLGCFLGKLVARPLRLDLGVVSVEAFAAGMFLVAAMLAWVTFGVRTDPERPVSDGLVKTFRDMWRVLGNWRFLGMVVQVGLFWAVQGQMYVTMPRYTLRLAGANASPEWYAVVNPLVVVLLILPLNHLTRGWSTSRILRVSYGTLAVATLIMGTGPLLVTHFGGPWHLAGFEVSPMPVAMITGCAMSGLAECFLIPHFLDRVAALAPPGQAALYQGYGYLTGLVSNLVGWGLSGYLIDLWCPDPALVPDATMALSHAAAGMGPWPKPWSDAPLIFGVWAVVAILAVVILPGWNSSKQPV